MSHRIIRPNLTSIIDPTLVLTNLVVGVIDLFDHARVGSTKKDQASCAAKVYLAIISAFEQKGYMRIAHAPDLWLDVGTSIYKVRIFCF